MVLQQNNCTPPKPGTADAFCTLWLRYKLLFNCMWFGALGGITISLKGVYDHGSSTSPWKNDYNLWHIGRPASGAVAGLIAGLLLYLIIPTEKVSPVIVYGMAFIFGTQDRAFFGLPVAGRSALPAAEQSNPSRAAVQLGPARGRKGRRACEDRRTGHR